MLRAFLGVEDGRDIQVHICVGSPQLPHEPHIFNKLSHKQWKANEDESCPQCGSARFLKKRGGLQSRTMAYYFGLGKAVQSI